VADDHKKSKLGGPVSLADMERQFQDDDALARAINSALMDADEAISRVRGTNVDSDTPLPETPGKDVRLDGEEVEISEEEEEELDLPIEQEPPSAPKPATPPKPQPSRQHAPKPQGLREIEGESEPKLEPPPQIRSGAAGLDESETYERLLRVMAEFENYKKRVAREQEEFKHFATEKLLVSFLPLMDNFDRAISHAEIAENVTVLLDGVKMIQRQMRDILLKSGVRGFDSVGQRFDPAKHQAMQTKATRDIEPGCVAEEFQRGYFLHDRLIRPALVVVAEAPSANQAADAELPSLSDLAEIKLPEIGEAPGAEEEAIIEDLEVIEETDQDTDIEELVPVDEET
jgi:molecular chaperone GrpE